MNDKICTKCKQEKSVDNYHTHKTNKDKLSNTCKSCTKSERTIYYENNKQKLIAYGKSYREENVENNREKYRKHYEENKKEIIKRSVEYERKRKKCDPLYKLRKDIRDAIRSSIKNNNFIKKNNTANILGCSIEKLKQHLESKFESWMNWENRGKYNGQLNYGWDIDHIIPSSSAANEGELIKLNHYTNLQPLCSYINRNVKKDNLVSLTRIALA